MNIPEYIIEIKQRDFACLGEELAEIVSCIEPYCKEGIWYAAHLDTTSGDNLKIERYTDFHPLKLGTSTELIALAKTIGQFLSGVFLLSPRDQGSELQNDLDTEGEYFRDLGDAIVEIRAFDTTVYQVYSNCDQILHALAEKFGRQIQTREETLQKWGCIES